MDETSTFKIFVPLQDLALNPGLSHILNQIIGDLNAKQLSHCRLVSKTLKDFIDNYKQWWKLQLDYVRKTETAFYEDSELIETFQRTEYKDLNANQLFIFANLRL